MLDEQALRRETFDPNSLPVVMADGQTWYLPRPAVELFPTTTPGGGFSLAGRTTFGPEFDAIVDAWRESEGEEKSIGLMFNMAAFIIRRNYDIPDDGWADLLRWSYTTDRYAEMWQSIFAIVRGENPEGKASALTSESA